MSVKQETDTPCNQTTLTAREVAAMRYFKKCIAERFCMGTQRIVSMQACWRAGLVEPLYVRGLIADWRITAAGESWNG